MEFPKQFRDSLEAYAFRQATIIKQMKIVDGAQRDQIKKLLYRHCRSEAEMERWTRPLKLGKISYEEFVASFENKWNG